jgi:hypothetical protein
MVYAVPDQSVDRTEPDWGKEKRHWLGACDEMTKRRAEQLRDEIMREANDQVFTIQNQIPFGEFVKLYLDQHVSTLAPPAESHADP